MEHPILDQSLWQHYLVPLREICLPLPEANETLNFGSPWFRAGKKVFAIFEAGDGTPSVSFRAAPMQREELLESGRFYPTPYMWHNGWVSIDLDDSPDWEELEELLVDSYRLQALKRQLRALDGDGPATVRPSTPRGSARKQRKERT